MSSFANFYGVKLTTEAKFREMPELVVQQANKIADEYFNQVKKLTPGTMRKLKKIGVTPDWKKYYEDDPGELWFVGDLTTTSFKDLTTNKKVKYTVYVAFGKNNKSYAECDYTNRIITIFDSNCRNLDRNKFVSVMVHEITHGFQQYKQYSKKYKKMKANKKSTEAQIDAQYYKEPIEFDAYTNEVAHTIKIQYDKLINNINNAKLPETKILLQKKLTKFLLELKLFISSPLETYFAYKELPLPSSLETFEDMLSTIVKIPKLWKKFKIKMTNLYNSLVSNQKQR